MKKIMTIPLEFVNYDQMWAIQIEIFPGKLSDWCLNLCLMEKGMIESLVLVDDDDKCRHKIIINLDPVLVHRGSVQIKDNKINISISTTELGHWLSFFLQYYSRGFADVDHIDVDLDSTSGYVGKEVSLMFKVTEYLPPLSSNEARRKLGL